MGMDMAEEWLSTQSEVEGMNMAKERLSMRLEVEGMDMTCIHMMEVDVKNMAEECPSKLWPEVEGIDMVKDTTVRMDWVERDHKCVVLVKHQTDDGAKRNGQTHQKRELGTWGLEGYWGGLTKFSSRDFSSPWRRRVEKTVKMRGNVCDMGLNHGRYL
jgi:hypothetical protein